MRAYKIFCAATIIIILLGCKLVSQQISGDQPSDPADPGPVAEPTGAAQFSAITFCQDVSDDGECIQAGTHFPSGSYSVWAYFTYENMQDGMAWGRRWTQDGEVTYEAMEEAWEDGESGWVAYSISDEENAPLTGVYDLTLYLEGEAVQSGGFEIDPPVETEADTQPAFGEILFGLGITEAKTTTNIADEFGSGPEIIYASFPYENIAPDQNWGREWLYNGEPLGERTHETWGTPDSGITWLSVNATDGGALAEGEYTLNLYLGDQVARSASFTIAAAEPQATAVGEKLSVQELVDPDLMPAYEMLANSNMELLWRLAELVVDRQIEMRMVDTLDGAIAAYSYKASTCELEPSQRQVGYLKVARDRYNQRTWEQVAASIAHELTHAFQHLSGRGRCEGCSIETEYEAFFVTISAMCEMGRMDLAQEEYGDLVYGNCSIDKDGLWATIKNSGSYSACPDY